MTTTADVIVIGLGAMGSAALYQLAKRGIKAIGIDQFAPPHDLGSSHGESRIVRKATGEGVAYTPLALRAYEIWHELEKESGETLMTVTGALLAAPQADTDRKKDPWLETIIESARRYNIPHEVLPTDKLAEQFPQFHLEETRGYYEPGAGFLRPEHCIAAQLSLAQKRGAQTRLNERVTEFKSGAGGVSIRTDKGDYAAQKLIVAAGPWVAGLFPRYAGLFKVCRQVVCWFDKPKNIEPYLPERCPVYVFRDSGGNLFYGFPALDGPHGGLKMADENYFVTTTPEQADRNVSKAEAQTFYEKFAHVYLPELDRRIIRTSTCFFTMVPDHNFIIDALPEDPRIIIASPCSGRGFKYSAAIGEVLAELAVHGKATIDIGAFSLSRFGNGK